MLPLPDPGHVAPPVAAHVQVGDWYAAGKTSTTVTVDAVAGPALSMTIV